VEIFTKKLLENFRGKVYNYSMKTFTAQFVAEFLQLPMDKFQEECRILTGVEATEVAQIDESTWFNITCEVDEDEVDPDNHFDLVGRDLARRLQCEVYLDDIFE
jgi:hypothetical protein